MSLAATNTILDMVKLSLADQENKVFTDTEYLNFIESALGIDRKISLKESSYTDAWSTTENVKLYGAYFDVDPAFLGSGITEDDFEYRFSEYTMVYVPVSVETRPSIDVYGREVNFNQIMATIYKFLASDAVRAAYVMGADGENLDRSGLYSAMLKRAQHWQGVRCL